MPGLMETTIKSLPFLHRGKVRDIYAVGDDKMLVVQTDRLSAFDVVMEDPIPNKGRILTAMSNFWFKKFGHLMPNHMTDIDPESLVAPEERDQVRGRAIVVKKFRPLPIEAIVRGYIIGTGWKDYQKTGAICGIKLPAGLKEAQKLPEVIFTPSTKAAVGEHDQNISFEKMKEIVGADIAEKVRDLAITLYREAADFAATKGILIADTKFEFGVDEEGKVYLIDEILTPDSSRFWPAASYAVGISPPSFDKQYVRDWLEAQPWDKKAPAPRLPEEVAQKTTEKYNEALRLLTA
ncbi:phosphoribosylaminoimidazolesuccinocarboxamide synthase [Oxalobacter paraformigenes]|uniref:Phosphoribosylaminoimidazole-succinocarboxamide synthase n=1 Tax=Oxalobacter paraformigenes TaxID=556268 RepID=C3X1K2_9BURK|nr:phosphoribosylaminoimidazolesuccinocarboxamide synthase [Oxalobacter paraformigenes]EEO27088.1 phosphoribosylaminoimidazolesuccinocarboxamide synthase [Oxalobacter paraformigenes]